MNKFGKVLDSIAPNFKQILTKQLDEDILGMNLHDDGNYDVDRMDYLYRDKLYGGEKITDYGHERYCRKHVKLDMQGSIITNSDKSIVLADDDYDNTKAIDVYKNQSLPEIEKFLELRVQNYEDMYFSCNTQVSDALVGHFLEYMLKDDSCDEGLELKKYVERLKEEKENINLQEFLAWDDIRFYENCIDYAENTKDENMKSFACMVIPNIDSLMNITYSHLDLKNARKSNCKSLSESQKSFINKIKKIIYSDDELSSLFKDKKYYSKNCLACTDEEKIKKLKEKYGDILSYAQATVYGYKKKEPIFVEDNQGRVFEFSKHPQRRCDWENRNETINVAYAAIPELRLKGMDENQIKDIIEDFRSSQYVARKKSPVYDVVKVNMSPVKVDTKMEEYFEI